MAKSGQVAPLGIRPSRFIPELNGVRGLAILAVLFFHFGSLYVPPSPTVADKLLMSLCGFGWTGVDLFFVLSGFLITGILLDTQGAANYFQAFYARRLLRIFPLYYGVLAIIFLLLPALKVALHHPNLTAFLSGKEQVWYWLHLSNWRSAFRPQAFLVTNFWTLSVEEQFYLIWPAAIAICPKRFYLGLCVVLIATALVLRNTSYFLHIQSVHDNFMYRLTPFRVDTLASGAAVAVLARTAGWRRSAAQILYLAAAAGVSLILAAIAVSQSVSPLSIPMVRVGYTGIGLACSAIVIYAVSQTGGSSLPVKALRSRLLMNFGEYSYGIYIFHGVIRYCLGLLTGRLSFGTLRSFSLLIVITGIGVAYLAAYCSFHAFEQHFLKLKRYFAYSPRTLQQASTLEA